MEQKKYYTNLDITKWICALFVVAIHAPPLEDIAPIGNVFLKDVVGRVAVALFFAMSGLGFFNKLIYKDGKIVNCSENRRNLFRYLKGIALLYVGWSAVYFVYQLPFWYQIGWWGWTLIKDCIVSFIFQGSYYHMWFLLALLYGIPALYIIMMYVPQKKMVFLTAFLCLVECALSSYAWLGFEEFLEMIPYYSLLDGPIHVVTQTVPLLYIGFLVKKDVKTGQLKNKIWMVVLCGMVFLAEAAALYFSGVNQSSLSFLLTTPILVYSIIVAVLSTPPFRNAGLAWKLRKSSVVIYCIHPLLLQLCRNAFAANQYVYWAIGSISSVGIGFAYALFLEKKRQRMAANVNVGESK